MATQGTGPFHNDSENSPFNVSPSPTAPSANFLSPFENERPPTRIRLLAAWTLQAYKANALVLTLLALGFVTAQAIAGTSVPSLVSRAAFSVLRTPKCRDITTPDGSFAFNSDACLGALATPAIRTIINSAILGLASLIFLIVLVRVALVASQTWRPSLKQALMPFHFWHWLVTQLLFNLVVFLGLILCIVPGIIAGFLLQFSPLNALDHGSSVKSSFTESTKSLRGNAVIYLSVLVIWMTVWALIYLVFMPLGIALIPLAALASAGALRMIRLETLPQP